jgi:hypothetical protein
MENHSNSGVQQWFDRVLLAIEPIKHRNPLYKFRVIELPARATTLQEVRVNGRRMGFTTEEQAEAWIGRNYPATVVLVQPGDIAEEIECRKGAIVIEEEDEIDELYHAAKSGEYGAFVDDAGAYATRMARDEYE